MEFLITLITILIDGMIYASWIFMVAVGLTLIFGVMGILNVAHGSMYAFGAYVAATMVGVLFGLIGEEGSVIVASLSSLGVLLVSAVLVGIPLGLLMERGLLRFMYGLDEVLMVLVTFAAFLILEDAIMMIWSQTLQTKGIGPGKEGPEAVRWSYLEFRAVVEAYKIMSGMGAPGQPQMQSPIDPRAADFQSQPQPNNPATPPGEPAVAAMQSPGGSGQV